MIRLNESELATLQEMRANVTPGQYWPIYQWLADLMIAKGADPRDSAVLWLRGATEANADRGAFSAMIRTYTQTQYQLRYGSTTSLMQEASDEVARNLLADLLGETPDWKRGEVPDIERIAFADAKAVGRVIFGSPHDTEDSAFKFNAAWSGALLFGMLRSDQTKKLIESGTPNELDTLSDLRDVLFAFVSYRAGAGALISTALTSTAEQRSRDAAITVYTWLGYAGSITWEYLINSAIAAPGVGVLGDVFSLIRTLGPNTFLDMLRGAMQGKALVGQTNDANFTATAQSFFSLGATTLQQLAVERLGTSPQDLLERAKADVNVRAALAALSLFSVKVDASVADQLALYDSATGIGLTENWLADRSAFLANYVAKLSGRGGIVVNGTGNLRYFDAQANLEVLVGAGSAQRKQFIFGGSEVDTLTGGALDDRIYGGAQNDTLNGMSGNDYLEGNDGNDSLMGGNDNDVLVGGLGEDTLDGGEGSDILRGGASTDLYRFSGTWGVDAVEDADGSGVVEVEGIGQLNGADAARVADGVWQTEDKRVNYSLVSIDSTRNDLYITFSDRTDVIVLRNWSQDTSNFGITLAAAPAAPTEISATLTGDFAKKVNGSSYLLTATGYASDGAMEGAEDVINGTNADEIILGLGGDDGLAGGGGADSIEGGAGSDLIFGGYGRDTLNGGSGNDFIFGSAVGVISTPSALNFTPPSANGVELGRGFSWAMFDVGIGGQHRYDLRGADSGVGVPGPGGLVYVETDGNLIDGGAGDDLIAAGTGNDTVHGGLDADRIFGLDGDDVLFGDAGDDHIWGDGNGDSSDGFYTPLSAHGDDVLSGGSGDDYLEGRGGNDILYGGDDNDALWGDGIDPDAPPQVHGRDYLDGGDGDDRLEGGGLDDILIGGDGDDRAWGDISRSDGVDGLVHGRDFLDGGAGNDQLSGGGSDDTVIGGSGDDLLWGEEYQAVTPLSEHGADLLDGGDGNDQLVGGGGGDTLLGGAGDDVIFGDDPDAYVAPSVHGGDLIDAGAGNDTIYGHGGNDTIVGGLGIDYLNGGDGDDVYVFGTGDSSGDGSDYELVRDSEGKNRFILQGAFRNSFAVRHDGQGNLILDSSATDRIVVEGGASNVDNRYELSDGTVYSYSGLIGQFAIGIISGMDANGRTYLAGGKTFDSISSTLANTTLSGGRGNDTLSGSGGGHTYRYDIGDGSDVIYDNSPTTNAQGQPVYSRVVFGESISLADLKLSGSSSTLSIRVGSDDEDRLQISGQQNFIFEFADGTNATYEQLIAQGFDGGAGSDSFSGSSGNDRISAGGGNDVVNGGAGHDSLSGDFGNDSLSGDEGSDFLDGGEGNDTLQGMVGSDTLQGGFGDDSLVGGDGADTYEFGFGGGSDTINNTDTDALGTLSDTLHLGPEVGTQDVKLTRQNSDLLLTLIDTGDSIRVVNYFVSQATTASAIERIAFADGTVWGILDVKALVLTGTDTIDVIVGYDGDDTLQGGARSDTLSGGLGADHLIGGSGADSIDGEAGADVLMGGRDSDTLAGGDGDDLLLGEGDRDSLNGGIGNDTLEGGIGNDRLEGGDGADVYRFSRGWGNDEVLNADADVDGTQLDSIVFGPDVLASDVILSRVAASNDLYVNVLGSDDRIVVYGYFSTGKVDLLAFVDGTQWTQSDVLARVVVLPTGVSEFAPFSVATSLVGTTGNDFLYGGSKNDTLDGGAGNDNLRGNSGDDVYRFGRGYGHDTIDGYTSELDSVDNDVVILGANVIASDVSLARDAQDLVLSIAGTQDTLRVLGYFAGDSAEIQNFIEEIRFADGTIWNAADISNFASPYMPATPGDDSLYVAPQLGSSVGAELHGLSGSDALTGRQGDDTLWGGEGRDYLYGSEGDDQLYGEDGDDYLAGSDGSDLLVGGAGNDELDAGYMPGDDTLEGGAGRDTLRGGGGTNLFIFEAGFGKDTIDTYYAAPGSSTLFFKAGIASEDLRIQLVGASLVLTFVGSGDSITVVGGIDRIGRIQFEGRETWELAAILERAMGGSEESQILVAAVPNATIYGLGGDDTIVGGNGWDELHGGDGRDQIDGADGNDLLFGERHSDVLFGGNGKDTLYGGEGEDSLEGGSGSDLLMGGAGNDSLLGGAGDDIYAFAIGDGFDFITEAAASGDRDLLWLTGGINPWDVALSMVGGDLVATVAGSADGVVAKYFGQTLNGNPSYTTISGITFDSGATWNRAMIQAQVGAVKKTGTEAADVLTGDSVHANRLTGLDGADQLIGGSASDWLDGGTGADTLFGGQGDDAYLVDSATDVVVEAASGGTDTVQSTVSIVLADEVENLWLVGDRNISGTGNALNNYVQGNRANNRLYGAGGADTLVGLEGDDTFVVEDASDTIVEKADEGFDTVESSVSYVLGANVERLVLSGSASINGTGNSATNEIVGNAGSNRLDGGGGYGDTLIGGAGDDIYLANNYTTVMETEDGGYDIVEATESLALSAYVEGLVLLNYAYNGTGNESANTITGNSYSNRIDGGMGDDTMVGGLGDDTYVVGESGDVIVELAGEGIEVVESAISWSLGDALENLLLIGGADINGSGNALANVLTGNGANNVLDGAGGNDTLVGGAGDDTYRIDSTGDVMTELAGQGIDTVETNFSFTLGTNFENLRLTGGGSVNATGNAANNLLEGNSGANRLNGGAGADSMAGAAGDDIYSVDNVGDVVIEVADEGFDSVEASVSFTLSTHVENLILMGTASINGTGNAIANALTGNSGANRLDGGGGSDTMTGGAGNDTYVVDNIADSVVEAASAGTDTVESSVSYALTANIEKLVLTGSASLDGVGNALANTLTGNSGANRLDGGAGADSMTGGAGDDVYVVDSTTDSIIEVAGGGVDTVETAITWTLGSEVERLVLTGSTAVNGTGNSLANELVGNSAANRLSGAGGADTMSGAAGDDTYVVDHAGDVIIELASEGTDTVESSISYALQANVERLTLTGTSSIDGLGNDLVNILTGNSGANRLNGGAGADAMTGGAGNDTFVVDNVGDTTIEAASGGTDAVESSISWTLAAQIENLTLTGSGAINATGNTLSNLLTGNAGNNVLDGGAGNDTMVGGDGDDTYYVDSASDVITEASGSGTDTVLASVSYTLAANVENLRINATGAVNATGSSGDNILFAGAGNNVLNGQGGTDTASYLYAGAAVAVSLAVTTAQSTGGSGSDTLQNMENLTGSSFSDTLTGSTGANIILGGAGNDTITAGGGNDRLDGGEGIDSLVGGTGNDIYFLGRGWGSDTITENDSTTGNLDVALFDAGIAADQLWFRQLGNNLEVSIIGTNDCFALTNWYLGSQYHTEQFKTSDGRILTDANVQNLVQAMAAFSPPAAGQTTLPANYQASLAPVIAANWQ